MFYQASKTPPRTAVIVILAVAMILSCTAGVFAATTYTVRSGDSLWAIANRYGTTVSALRSANGLSGSTIYAGQKLLIPTGDGKYTVRSGDSLWAIANRHGTTVNALMSANGLSSSRIYPGQTLRIPAGGSVMTASRGSGSLSSADADLLARLVRAEAGGEPYSGQVAVAAVVLNRAASSRFPNTVRGVIYQQYQFEPVANGRINVAATETQRRAVRDALSGWDPSGGALYFYNPRGTSNRYLLNRPVTTAIGGHVFAR